MKRQLDGGDVTDWMAESRLLSIAGTGGGGPRRAEWTKHAMNRMYQTTYDRARYLGIRPKSMNPLELFRMYSNEVRHTAFNKTLFTHALQMTDINGDPIVVIKPGTDYAEDSVYASYPIEVLTQNAKLMANMMGLELRDADDPIKSLNEMVTEHFEQKGDPRYERAEWAPGDGFQSVAAIYVQKSSSPPLRSNPTQLRMVCATHGLCRPKQKSTGTGFRRSGIRYATLTRR